MKIVLISIGFNLLLYPYVIGATSEEEAVEKARALLERTSIVDEATVIEAAPVMLPTAQISLQSFFEHEYNRGLVTRFVNACPKVIKLAEVIGRTPATVSKLKKPEVYGPLTPTAEALWTWLRSNGVVGLVRALSLSEEQIAAINESLKLIDLSGQNIVYDELGDDIRSETSSLSGEVAVPQLISKVIIYLRGMKDTFIRINLSNNLLSDEGLVTLVSELREHQNLEEIDLRENRISDVGLRKVQDLMRLPKLKCLCISENYGPSEDTITDLVSWATATEQPALRAKIR